MTTTIDSAAVAAWPREACGLVISTPRGPRALPAQNLSKRADSFELDPAVLFETRRNGWAIVGIYHSHCGVAAVPSAADLHHAKCWPQVVHAIVSVGSAGVVSRRGYRVVPDGVAPSRLL